MCAVPSHLFAKNTILFHSRSRALRLGLLETNLQLHARELPVDKEHSRSCPQKRSPSTTNVGAPKTPLSSASEINCAYSACVSVASRPPAPARVALPIVSILIRNGDAHLRIARVALFGPQRAQ